MICLALCGAFTLAAGEVWLRDGARLPGEIKLADGAVEVGGRRVPVAAVRAIHWGEPPRETPKTVAGALPTGWKAVDLGTHKQPLAVAYDRGQFTMEAFEVENPRNRMVRIQQEFVAKMRAMQNLPLAERRAAMAAFRKEVTAMQHQQRAQVTDAYSMLTHSLKGDAAVMARLDGLETAEGFRASQAGVFLRAGLGAQEWAASLTMQGDQGVTFRWGVGRNGRGGGKKRLQQLTAPVWLKLERGAGFVMAYVSDDGLKWELMHVVENVRLPASAQAGLLISMGREPKATARFSHARVGDGRLPTFNPQVVLANGTVVARAFAEVSEARVRFAESLEGLAVRGADVARLVFSPLAAVERIPNRRTGVLLRSGDFVDGEFSGLKDGRITISSVLFGKKEFAVEEEAVALVLRPVRKRTAAFEVHCVDGSVLRVSGLKLAPAGAQVDVPAAGKFVVPAKNLSTILSLSE